MADTPYLTPAQYQRAAYDATCTSTMQAFVEARDELMPLVHVMGLRLGALMHHHHNNPSTMDGRTSINAGIEAVAMALEVSAQQSGKFCSVTHHDAYLGFEALIRAQYNLWERPSDAYLQG